MSLHSLLCVCISFVAFHWGWFTGAGYSLFCECDAIRRGQTAQMVLVWWMDGGVGSEAVMMVTFGGWCFSNCVSTDRVCLQLTIQNAPVLFNVTHCSSTLSIMGYVCRVMAFTSLSACRCLFWLITIFCPAWWLSFKRKSATAIEMSTVFLLMFLMIVKLKCGTTDKRCLFKIKR